MAVGYNPRAVTDGLVLTLDAGNTKSYPGSGTAWSDLIGSNNGALTNGPTYSSDDGGAIVFDGSNDYVDCGNVDSNISDNLTLSLWIKFPVGYGPLRWDSIIAKRAPGNKVNYGINYNPTATNIFQIYYSNFGASLSVPLSSNFSDNVWINICGTFAKNSTTTDMILYNNASVIGSTNKSGNVTPPANLQLQIGTYLGGGEYFQGNIAQVSIYNRALTASEVLQNYNATKGRFGI